MATYDYGNVEIRAPSSFQSAEIIRAEALAAGLFGKVFSSCGCSVGHWNKEGGGIAGKERIRGCIFVDFIFIPLHVVRRAITATLPLPQGSWQWLRTFFPQSYP